jgi:hypothetical protein
MRAIEFLTEGRGLYARTLKDPPFSATSVNAFGAKQGDPYKFQGITNYPEIGAYETPEQFNQDLEHINNQVKQQSGKDIIWSVKPTKAHKAFGLAQFVGPNNKVIYFGKPFNTITPSMMHKWDNNELAGLQPELTGSKKARAGYKPQDIFGSRSDFTNGSDLLDAVQDSNTIQNIKDGLLMMSTGRLPVFVGEGANLTAVRDNLGEVIQSIAITHSMVGGPADAARQKLLNNQPWEKLKIHFPAGKTAGLVDFELHAGNFKLGVSSKGAKGAPASVANLIEGIENAKNQKNPQYLDKEFPMAASVIQTIADPDASMISGPLELAILFNMITHDQGMNVMAMIKSHQRENPPPWIAKWTQAFSPDPNKDWNYGYWVLAAIAAKVAEIVNADPEFSKGCMAFLNHSSMMQLYTDAKKVGDDVHITGFRPLYPPNFDGTVVLDSGKGYYASGVNQKFVFDFLPNKKK